MRPINSLQAFYLSRRGFLKIAAAALFGVLAACAPKITGEGPSPAASAQPAQPLVPPSATPQPSATPVPPSATSQPSATPVPPSATPQPTHTPTPTSCPADVECNQAVPSARNPQSRLIRAGYSNAPNIITGLCLRDSGCVEVCPMECIVPGRPESKWPRYYIDGDACTSCGACIPECPYGAIFPADGAPSQYIAKGGEYINRVGICGHYEGINHYGEPVKLDTVCRLKKGQVVDLTIDIVDNDEFFTRGPGYSAW